MCPRFSRPYPPLSRPPPRFRSGACSVRRALLPLGRHRRWLISDEPAASAAAVLAVSASGAAAERPRHATGASTSNPDTSASRQLQHRRWRQPRSSSAARQANAARTQRRRIADATHFLGGGGPTATIPASSTAVMYVDVVMPRRRGARSRVGSPSRISFIPRSRDRRADRWQHHRPRTGPARAAPGADRDRARCGCGQVGRQRILSIRSSSTARSSFHPTAPS